MTAPELSPTERATVQRFERAPDALPTDAEVGALLSAVFHALGTHALSGHTSELERRLSDAAERIIEAREKAAGARALREAQREVQAVYDMQCPTMTPDRYVDRGAWMAHQWWQSVLGGTLRKLRDRADRIEDRP